MVLSRLQYPNRHHLIVGTQNETYFYNHFQNKLRPMQIVLHHAMKTDKYLKGFEKRVAKLEKTEKILKEKAPRIREGDNEAVRDAILKKRVACFN